MSDDASLHQFTMIPIGKTDLALTVRHRICSVVRGWAAKDNDNA
jgi:hypothetical protein